MGCLFCRSSSFHSTRVNQILKDALGPHIYRLKCLECDLILEDVHTHEVCVHEEMGAGASSRPLAGVRLMW